MTLERVKGSPPAVGARREPDKYIGTTIDGRYIVESVLGEGGMGVVYKCRRKVFDRPAALKILRADLAKNPEVLERFYVEVMGFTVVHRIRFDEYGFSDDQMVVLRLKDDPKLVWALTLRGLTGTTTVEQRTDGREPDLPIVGEGAF